MENKTYEESMKELEQVVKDLESGELSLDESIKKFEKGMELSKHCSSLLEDAEKKITLLIEKENGEVSEESFEIDEE
ncbi:MAG: exodeoxyribonuclease VII small subunit [Clostridia bacterium]|nr:exodeoxyribonuclease VII small subunit [Clostridia bacterium]